MLDKALDNANIEMILVNKSGEIVYGNNFFKAHHDFESESTDIFDIFIELTRQKWLDEWNYLQKNGSRKYDAFIMQLEGRTKYYEVMETLFIDEEEILACIFLNDIENRKELEENLMHSVTHDSLTELPNRKGMDRVINRMLKYEKGSVMFIDLDNFKRVNDIYGHETGDELIQKVAERIKSVLPDNAILGRQSGDEFILVLNDIESFKEGIQLAKNLTDALKMPFNINKNILYLSASIGTAFYPEHGSNRTAILSSADIAMYKAKARGKARFVLYNNEMKFNMIDRHNLYLELERALENNEFELYLQPIYNVQISNIILFETFIRWNHPEKGVLYPLEFIPLAEETGLIIEIGKWVIRELTDVMAKFREKGLSKINFSLNLSLFQLDDPDFVSYVTKYVNTNDLKAKRICFELSEELVQNISHIEIERLKELRENGFKLAIHDFGYKYALMSIVDKIEPDIIKINKLHSKIKSLEVQKQIITNLKTLADYLDIKLFCEGVETEAQYSVFKEIGIKYMQGYHLGRPQSVNACIKNAREELFF
ncbi:MAG: EAL domain-containing protein [Clostridia bacterium]|nr:EAL domain-containing protein [Clostridia bacterium]